MDLKSISAVGLVAVIGEGAVPGRGTAFITTVGANDEGDAAGAAGA